MRVNSHLLWQPGSETGIVLREASLSHILFVDARSFVVVLDPGSRFPPGPNTVLAFYVIPHHRCLRTELCVGPLLTAMNRDPPAVRDLFGGLLKWRVGVRWYVVPLPMPAALCFSAVALHVLLGGSAPQLYRPVPRYLLPAYFLVVLLFVGPVPKEIGWCRYALPMLQAKRSALSASLILGSSWARREATSRMRCTARTTDPIASRIYET